MATVTSIAPLSLPVAGGDIDAEPITNQFTNILTFLNDSGLFDESNANLTDSTGLVGKSTAQDITGLKSFENTGVGGGGVRTVAEFGLDPSSVTQADNDGVRLLIYGDDDAATPNKTTYASLNFVFTDTGDASEDCRMDFYLVTAGSLASEMQLDGASLRPTTSDGLALGDVDQMFSDLFLASGAVINFNAGNVTLTHAAGLLTLAGGALLLPGSYTTPFRIGTTRVWEDATNSVLRAKVGSDPSTEIDGNIIMWAA